MLKKTLLIIAAVVVVGALGVYLVAKSVLGSDKVRAAIERQATEAVGQPVRVGSATVSVFPRVGIDLGQVAVGEPAAVTLERMSLATGLKALLSRRIEGAEIIVADSRVTLPLPFRIGAGEGPAEPQAVADSEPEDGPALTIVSIDTIALRNLQLAVRDQTLTIDLESSLAGDRLDIHRISATSDVSRLEATGELTSLSKSQGSINIKGNPLDLDELLTIFSGIATTGEPAHATPSDEPRPDREPSPLQIRVSLEAPTGRVAGYDLVDIGATLDMSATQLSLEPFGFGIFAGRYDGKATIVLTDDTPGLTLDGALAGIDMAEVVRAAGAPGAMTGTLGGTLEVTSKGADSTSMMKQARGRASAAITDGNIPGLEMVRTVILAFGRSQGAPPEGSGSAFSRLGGTFTLANGVLSSGDIAFASRDFDMRAEGTVSLLSGALDIDADIVLSEELSAQAGSDLVKFTQEKGRVVLPGTISGTLEKPRIFVDVKEAMGRAAKRGAESLLKGLIKKRP